MIKNNNEINIGVSKYNFDSILNEFDLISFLLGYNPEIYSDYLKTYSSHNFSANSLLKNLSINDGDKWRKIHDRLLDHTRIIVTTENGYSNACTVIRDNECAKKILSAGGVYNGSKLYIQTLYNHGIILPYKSKPIITHFFPEGLTYDESSIISKTYKTLKNDGFWSFHEAVKYFTGNDIHSDFRDQEGHINYGLALTEMTGKQLLRWVHEDDKGRKRDWRFKDNTLDKYRSLSELCEKHMISGKLAHKGNLESGEPLFEPKIITKWIKEITTVEPAPILNELFTVTKNFSHSVNVKTHEDAYKKYIDSQIQEFLDGHIEKPWKSQTIEEPILKSFMGGMFNRQKFRDARNSILSKYPNNKKTKFSRQDIHDLREHFKNLI